MEISPKQLSAALQRYDEALLLKHKDLPALDAWYRGDLRDAIRKRTKEKDAHITSEELIMLMEWKLKRGKFRPSLMSLVADNDATTVKQKTRAGLQDASALDKLKETWSKTLDTSMKHITALRGVGPATASAILATAFPRTIPYMSDEVLAYGVGLREKPKYSKLEYAWLVEETTKRLKGGKADEVCLSEAEVLEKAAWAYGVLEANGKLQLDGSAQKGKRRSTSLTDNKTASPTKRRRR